MKRILLSLIFVFGLINFAYAENEKVTLTIETVVLRCSRGGFELPFCAPGLEPGLPSHSEDVTFELIKDENLSNETYEFYWAVWSKDFSEQGFEYSSVVNLFKRVFKHENGEPQKVYYSIVSGTGFTPNAMGVADTYYLDVRDSVGYGLLVSLLGGDIVKKDKIYRTKLSIWVGTNEPTDKDKE